MVAEEPPCPLLAVADCERAVEDLERAVVDAEGAVAAALRDRAQYETADRALFAAGQSFLRALAICDAIKARAHVRAYAPGDRHGTARKAVVKRALVRWRVLVCQSISIHNRARRARQHLDLPPNAGLLRRLLARIVWP